jgi:DNA-binding NarL/FixJ family response regulator
MGPVPVFIVDDSQSIRETLQDLLLSTGKFQVVGTAGGETDATQWLMDGKQPWRLAIVDLLLSEGSGFGVLQRCRFENPAGKIFVFSEFATPAIRDRCLKLGADAVFTKSEAESMIARAEQLVSAP